MSVNDEGNQTPLQVLPNSSCEIQHRGRSAVDFCRYDRGALIEDMGNVDAFDCDRRDAESRTGEGIRVLMLSALRFNQKYERLIGHSMQCVLWIAPTISELKTRHARTG